MDTLGRTCDHVMQQLQGALVVAVDDSPPAGAALRFAAHLAERSSSPLHVVMVWNVVIGPHPEASPDHPANEQDRQREADRVLGAFGERTLASTGRPELHLHAVHANVDVLLEDVTGVARHVVVGSRGRGGVADLLLGSTSAQLVSHARCPVTVVPSTYVGSP
jgi:nucleotide-binding universal stress UspA family protein